jgi:hypothetical protein
VANSPQLWRIRHITYQIVLSLPSSRAVLILLSAIRIICTNSFPLIISKPELVKQIPFTLDKNTHNFVDNYSPSAFGSNSRHKQSFTKTASSHSPTGFFTIPNINSHKPTLSLPSVHQFQIMFKNFGEKAQEKADKAKSAQEDLQAKAELATEDAKVQAKKALEEAKDSTNSTVDSAKDALEDAKGNAKEKAAKIVDGL